MLTVLPQKKELTRDNDTLKLLSAISVYVAFAGGEGNLKKTFLENLRFNLCCILKITFHRLLAKEGVRHPRNVH